jgi:hypothetical protein
MIAESAAFQSCRLLHEMCTHQQWHLLARSDSFLIVWKSLPLKVPHCTLVVKE